MINRCVRCWEDFELSFRCNVCDNCTSVTPGFPDFKPGLSDHRILLKGTEFEGKMTNAEVAEIKRQVAIPIGNGRFAGGRRMENGRIAEKHIGN